MKKVTMRESSYDMLKEKILEGKFDNINEISHGTVSRAYDRSDDLFYDARVAFEDFYTALDETLYKVKYESNHGEQTNNPYLDKIKNCADIIYDLFNQKKKQQDKFYDETMNKFDYKKFYGDKKKPEEWEDNYDDLDLRMLQQKYPK